MSTEIPTPETIWIVTGEIYTQETSTTVSGARSSHDIGGMLGTEEATTQVVITQRKPVEVAKLKQEMKAFLQAMRETLDEADPPNSKIRLDEVELSVEINGEGQVSLFGIGGKAGGKGTMTFKFKRRDG
jgi:hypothetical protein